jgi:hypothetical protein
MGLADGGRATARERKSKTTAAPAPNKTHCHVAKVGSDVMRPQLHNDAPPGHPQFGSDTRRAVQTPIPTPTGTEPKRRRVVAMRLMNRCYFLDVPATGR